MKKQTVKRTVRFEIEWDDGIAGAKSHVLKRLRDDLHDRNSSMPLSCSGASARYGSYAYRRVFR